MRSPQRGHTTATSEKEAVKNEGIQPQAGIRGVKKGRAELVIQVGIANLASCRRRKVELLASQLLLFESVTPSPVSYTQDCCLTAVQKLSEECCNASSLSTLRFLTVNTRYQDLRSICIWPSEPSNVSRILF